jgi:hypothetical protein
MKVVPSRVDISTPQNNNSTHRVKEPRFKCNLGHPTENLCPAHPKFAPTAEKRSSKRVCCPIQKIRPPFTSNSVRNHETLCHKRKLNYERINSATLKINEEI